MTTGELDPQKHVDDPGHNAAVEVLYAGGGNVVALFREDTEARQFTRNLSEQVLLQAPNLQLVIAQQPFEWKDSLYDAVEAAFQHLVRQGRARTVTTALLGSSVTAMCRSTGTPAVGYTTMIKNDPTSMYPASAEILAKYDLTLLRGHTESETDQRLRTMAPLNKPDLKYPSDFDDLGRSAGEHSFIAVVHADGNSMGQRIRELGQAQRGNNRKYIEEMRAFSDAVDGAARAALRDTVEALTAQINDKTHTIVHRNPFDELARIDLARDTDQDGNPIDRWFVPFRPIVFGGDDVTFVCDGRLGLSLALTYLDAFEKHTEKLASGKATACAGVAIVKTHYPFARAYALAEELCGSAKEFRRKRDLEGACLDWHFALSGLAGDLKEIRTREYDTPRGSLTQRPVTAKTKAGYEVHSWETVRAGVNAFQDVKTAGERPDWSARRNKVKALRDALRNGGEAVEHFRLKFLMTKDGAGGLPDVGWTKVSRQRGWDTIEVKEGAEIKHQAVCAYFDAIELADWFIPVEGEI